MKKILKKTLGLLILAMIMPAYVMCFLPPNMDLMTAFFTGILIDIIAVVLVVIVFFAVKLITD